MPLYETVVIARSEITQAQADAVADAVTAQLEADGGAVKKREYWGLRNLAYRIKRTARAITFCSASTRRPLPSPRWSASSA